MRTRYSKRPKFSNRRRKFSKRPSGKRFYRRVEGCIRKFAEKKYINGSYTNQPDYLTGTVSDLTSISAGTGKGQRIGQHIKPGILHFRCDVTNQAAQTSIRVRVMIVQTFHTTTYPTLADVLKESGTQYAPISPYNRDSYLSYKVLWDRMVVVDYYRITKQMKANIKIKKGIEWFSANAGDWINGSLWLMLVSDTNSNKPSVMFSYSFTFTDV